MTLRRISLTRRTELRRGPNPRLSREPKDRIVRAARRQHDTGPTDATRALVLDRAGLCCEVCGTQLYALDVGWLATHSFHHRRPRGMGGTSRPETNSPANLLLLCGTGTTGCHGWVETNRYQALAVGYLVGQNHEPVDVVVELCAGRVTLTHDGTYQEAA